MLSIASLIATYGYYALFLGTLLEGETVLVAAGYAAHRGLLELPWVIVIAFLAEPWVIRWLFSSDGAMEAGCWHAFLPCSYTR